MESLQRQLDAQEPGRFKVMTADEALRLQQQQASQQERPAPQQTPQAPQQQPSTPELRPWEPTLWDRIKGLFGPNKDAATVERVMRESAREQGISVDQAYRRAGGWRPLFNPEGRPPIQAGFEAATTLANQVPDILPAAVNTILRAIRGGNISADPSLIDRWIARTETQQPELVDPNYEAFQGVGESLGYSLITLAASAVSGAIGSLAGPIGSGSAAMSGSGAVAYRASKDEFLERVKDKLDKEAKAIHGRALSAKEWDAARQEFDAAAAKYGAWEAVPEAVSNLIFVKALSAPLRGAKEGAVRRVAQRAAHTIKESLPAEYVTETATAAGQNRAELEAGLTNDELSVADAFRRQLIPTTLVTLGLAGGGSVAREVYDAVERRLAPGRAMEREFGRAVDETTFVDNVDEIARQSFDSSNAQYGMEPSSRPEGEPETRLSEEPELADEGRVSPVLGAAPASPVPEAQGPLGRALRGAIEQNSELLAEREALTQEAAGARVTAKTRLGEITGTIEEVAPDGTMRLLSDEGMMYEFGPSDGVEIGPVAPQTEGAKADDRVRDERVRRADAAAQDGADLSEGRPRDLETAAEGRGVDPAAPAQQRGEAVPDAAPTADAKPALSEQPSPRRDRPLDEMTEEELRDRLKFVVGQAKLHGWDARLLEMRRDVERAINAKAADQKPVKDEAPATSGTAPTDTAAGQKPVKWFGSREKAAAWVAKQKKGKFEIVQDGRRFNVYERTAQPGADTESASLVLKSDGSPFASRQQAERAAKNRRLKDYAPVEVEGGFALAPVSQADQPSQHPAESAAEGEAVDPLAAMGFKRVGGYVHAMTVPDPEGREHLFNVRSAGGKFRVTRSTRFPKTGVTGAPTQQVGTFDTAAEAAAAVRAEMARFDVQEQAAEAVPSSAPSRAITEPSASETAPAQPSQKDVAGPRNDIADGTPVAVINKRTGQTVDVGIYRGTDARTGSARVEVTPGEISFRHPDAYEIRPMSGDSRSQAPAEKSEPTVKAKRGRAGAAALKKLAEAAGIPLDDTASRDTADLIAFFDRFYEAGRDGRDMPRPDMHPDDARAAYEAGRKDREAANRAPKANEFPRSTAEQSSALSDTASVRAKSDSAPAPEQAPAEASQPADDGAAQWNALTPAGRRAALKAAGVKLPDAVMWEHISDEYKQKLRPVVSNMLERATDPQAAPAPAPAPAVRRASVIDNSDNRKGEHIVRAGDGTNLATFHIGKDGRPVRVKHFFEDGKTRRLAEDAMRDFLKDRAADPLARFANNKIFTADKVEAARARLRSKLSQMNSGIDPEVLIDGMTIAGAYIEAGVRNFRDFAGHMVADFGDKVKPYLLSFWEGARNYPGIDTDGMTSVDESARIHAELMAGGVPATEAAAVGEVAEKPKQRTRKTGKARDRVLTQDWGVDHINGYSDDPNREIGNEVKDAFLKEARSYLNAVRDELMDRGYEEQSGVKRTVRVDEGGVDGSGDVSLVLRAPNGRNVYVHIGASALRGVVPTTPSGIAIMFRSSAAEGDTYGARGTNRWAPVDLSAADLANMIDNEARGTIASTAPKVAETGDGQDQSEVESRDRGRGEASEGGRGSAAQPGTAPADSGDVAAGQPEDVAPAESGRDGGDAGVRSATEDVGGERTADQGRGAVHGRPRAGGAQQPDAGARSGVGGGRGRGDRAGRGRAAAGERASGSVNPETISPAHPSAGNFHIENPLEIVGGGQVARFKKNQAAIELYNELRDAGRPATREEQAVLAGYTGWGSFGQELFQGTWENPRPKQGWEERDAWLRDHLGQAEWEGMQRSITNAHYTDPPTVLAMWDMMKRMGFQGGRVLEPSMGIGNFFGMMPADLKARSNLTGIELDPVTGGMAKLIYPDANISIMGYQDSKTPDNFYDVVIGNWPFEDTVIADRRYNRLSPYLHDYFFLKAVDQVRPGGIVMGITSKGTMDKMSSTIRTALAKKAELVAAFRLPSGAFEEYAGTKVVTDIIILRKRAEPKELVGDEGWIKSVPYETPQGEKVNVNEYYIANPQHVIGRIEFGHGTTFRRPGMIVTRPDDMMGELARIVSMVPEGAYLTDTRAKQISYIANHTADREGALTRQDGKFYVVRGEHLAPASQVLKYEVKDAKKTAAREAQFNALIDMRQTYGELVEAERGARDADPEPIRKKLRAQYDAFVKEHGRLNDSFGLGYLFRINDPFYPALAALEIKDGDTYKPAAVLDRSTIRPPKRIKNPSITDAFVLARNQSINPSLEQIAEIAGRPADEVKAELLAKGAIFELPNGDITPSDMYLSGNVREKLRQAEAALENGNKAMERNVEELRKVLPPDVPYFRIEAQLGATWVPQATYAEYIAYMLGLEGDAGIEVTYRAGRWKARIPNRLLSRPEASTGFGTSEYKFSKLVNAALSNQSVTIRKKDSDGNEYVDVEATQEVNNKISEIRSRFGEWLWSDPERRVALEREYNDTRNAYAAPRFDGSFLSFEGMALSLGNGPFDLRKHQVDAIWRALVTRKSLNAHEVGTGKAQPLDAKVLTPTGWKRMGDIQVGDQVITQSGQPTTVEAVFPQGEKEIFRVVFSDGSSTECCDEHLWLTQTYRERSSAITAARLGKDWPSAKPKVRSLAEIRTTLVAPHLGAKNHSIPMVGPVQFESRSVPIDPYMLGALLGDGTMSHGAVCFTNPDLDIVYQFDLPDNVQLVEQTCDGCFTVRFTQIEKNGRSRNPMVEALESLGLMNTGSHERFVPDCYLFNDAQVRLAVLRGIMDTDGYVENGGKSTLLTTTSERLANDVAFLVQSFGGTAAIKAKQTSYVHKGERRQGRTAYVVTIRLPADINPFFIPRKANAVVPKTRYQPVRYIVDVQPVGRKPAQCIRVSDPSHLYVTDDFIVTHNTFTMGGIAVESRRYGIAKKPMILAHNANSKSVAAEIQQMYPAAKVLYIDNLSRDQIATRLRQIANDDWDAVVVPHSLLSNFAFREDTLMAMAREEIAALEEEALEAAREDGASLTLADMDDEAKIKALRSPTAKDLVKQRNRIIETIKKQAQRASKEGAIPFEELGIDMLLVDEAHAFKKAPISTRMRMKGLNTGTSDRSIALYYMARYLRAQNNGGNIHLFTGTPITNTLTEIYHQMRYIMGEEMADSGVDYWDGWFGSFASEVMDVELNAAGEYESVTRLAGFVNVPELRRMIGQYMDVVFADEMPEMQPRRTKSGKTLHSKDLTDAERNELLNGRTEGATDRPYKKVINDTADLTPAQADAFREIQQYARRWRNMSGQERKKAMLSGAPESPIIYENLAAKASFDVRLLNAEELAGMEGKVPDDPNSKASRVIKNVLDIYRSDPRATQVIFTQQGISKTATRSVGEVGAKRQETYRVFSTVHDMIERMVQQGIPREQIALVDGSTSKDKRKEIADAMNRAEIRVVIGSTESLGVGVNMQRNLRAMHHMDAPWMPGDLEQRNGRGHRQGNQWNTVLEFRYLTDRIDGRRWQVLAIKQRFINAFLKADDSQRIIEGDAASEDEADILQSFAEAAGDPRILIRAKLKKKLDQMRQRERLHGQGVADARRMVRRLEEERKILTDSVARIEASGAEEKVADAIQRNAGSKFTAKIAGKEYTERKDAQKALDEFVSSNVREGDADVPVGSYAGHQLTVTWPKYHSAPHMEIEIAGERIGGSRASFLSLESALRGFSGDVEKMRRSIEEKSASINRAKKVAAEPFQQADQLKALEQQLADLEADLQANPVAPPAWLRVGAPVESIVYWNDRPFEVTGHRWTGDGWFVLARDENGQVAIPYLEAKDEQGMALYDERPFEKPEVVSRQKQESQSEDEAKYSAAGQTGDGLTVPELKAELRRSPLGDAMESLIRDGRIVLHDTVRSLSPNAPAGVHAATWPDGTIHLVADELTRETVMPALLHEAFHGAVERLIGSEQWNALLRRLGALYRQAERSGGRMNTFWRGAQQRIANAEAMGDRMTEARRIEEFGAYAIENYESAPASIRKWVDDLIGAIKAWLLRRFGIQAGQVTPAQLRALAVAALRDAGAQAQQAPAVTLPSRPLGGVALNDGPLSVRDVTQTPDIRYSVSEKNAALNAASKALKQAREPGNRDFDGGVIRDLGKIAAVVQHPYTIASMNAEFTPVFDTALKQAKMRDEIIADFYQDYRAYRDLPEESRRRVNKVLELGRLTHRNYKADDLENGIRNPGSRRVVVYDANGNPIRRSEPLNAALSKPGETIKLTEAERDAYLGLRAMFDRALDRFADQILIDMGLDEFINADKPSEAILDSISDEMTPARAEFLRNAAKTMAEIEQAKRTGYVPLSRYGRYAITVKEEVADLQWTKNPDGGWIVRGVPEDKTAFMKEIGAEWNGIEGGWQVDGNQRKAVREEFTRTVYSEKVELGNIAKFLDERRAEAKGGPILSIRKVRAAKERIEKEWVQGHPNRRITVIDTNRKAPEGGVRLSEIDALADLAMLDQDTWAQVREQFADAVKGRGFRKHFFHSDNVPGYSTDFERAIGDYIGGMAGHLSRRFYERQWEDAIGAIKGKRLYAYAKEYRDYINSPVEEYALTRQAGFLMYLAGNVSTALINATQTHLMAVPTMAQFAPTHLVNVEVARAYKDALKMTSLIDKKLEMFDPNDAPADVRDVVKEAWDEGAFAPRFTHEVMGNAGESTGKARARFDKSVEVIASSFTYVERLNRLVTFIAAARLAQRPAVRKNAERVLAKNAMARHTLLGDRWSPKAFAEFVVNESQFLMGKANRAKMFRSHGALIFQFMSFVSQSLQAWYRWASLQGTTGKMMAAASIAAITVLSGLWGLPGLDHLRAAYEAAYLAITGEDEDLRTKLRAWIYEVSGSVWLSEVASKGVLYPAGVDVSNRIGFQQILPDASSVTDLFGVQADLWIGRPKRAWEKHAQGRDYEAMAELLPNFARNPVMAYSWSQEGIANARGKQILTPEQIPESALWWKAFGFQPSIVNDVHDYLYAQYREQTKRDTVKGRFLNRLARAEAAALRNTDPARQAELDAAVDAVWDEIDAYNDRLGDDEAPVDISTTSLNSAIDRELYGIEAQFGTERRDSRESAERLRELFRIEERLLSE